MVAVLNPFGMRPMRFRGGGPQNAAVNRYLINPGYATNIFTGDPVRVSSNGFIIPLVAKTGKFGLGVFQGVQYVDPTTKRPTFSMYYPANTTPPASGLVTALVVDDPKITYIVAADAALTQAKLGTNFKVSAGSAGGSTTTGLSGVRVIASSFNTSPTNLHVRSIDIYQTPDNAIGDAAPTIEVQFIQANTQDAAGTAFS